MFYLICSRVDEVVRGGGRGGGGKGRKVGGYVVQY